MNVQRDRIQTILQAIIHELKVERITFMAGSIAYNAFLSLLPMLLLLVAVLGTVSNQRVEDGLASITRAALTPGAADVLVTELQSTSAGASAVGLIALVWGALRIFRSLDTAFSDIYETQAENTMTNQLHDGLIVLVSVTAVVCTVVAVESFAPGWLGGTAGWLGQRLLLIVAVGAALTPIYYLFPDEDGMELIEVVPGVVVTAIGLVVAESLFRLYIEYGSTNAENSLLSGIIILLTWLYVSGLIILVGAAVNAVLSNRSEDVSIEPVIGGVPVDDAETTEQGTAGDTANPIQAVDELSERLPTATEVEIVVDGTPVAVPPPDRVDTDRGSSAIPFVNDTVSVDVHWNAPDDSSGDTDQRDES